MKGENELFLGNPENYLKSKCIACYNVGTSKMWSALQAQGVSGRQTEIGQLIKFDLRNNGTYVDLVISADDPEDDVPITAGFIPFMGMSGPNKSKFGCINLSDFSQKLILTVGFTGCNFVFVKQGGSQLVYHEPTEESRLSEFDALYEGSSFQRVGPDYSLNEAAGGLGILIKSGGGWRAFVQTSVGVKVEKFYDSGVIRLE